MSDEEEYVDIERVVDDDGELKEDGTIVDLFDVVISDPTPADKRAHHNALERRRRDHIKDSFNSLLACIPNIASYKNSRAQTLKKATDYIILLKSKNNKLISDLETLRSQTKLMEQQVSALERIKSTSQFVMIKDGTKDSSGQMEVPAAEHNKEGEEQRESGVQVEAVEGGVQVEAVEGGVHVETVEGGMQVVSLEGSAVEEVVEEAADDEAETSGVTDNDEPVAKRPCVG